MAYTGPNVPDNSSGTATRTSTTLPDAWTFIPPVTPAPAGFNLTRDKVDELFPPLSTNDIRATIQKTLSDLKTRERNLQTEIKELQKKYDSAVAGGYTTQAQQLLKKITTAKSDLTVVRRGAAAARERLRQTPYKNDSPETAPSGTGTPNVVTTTTPGDNIAAINLSACKELYFRTEQKFLMETLDIPANSPGFVPSLSPIATSSRVEELWKRGIATKGRIQTFSPFTGNASGGALGGRSLEEFATTKARGRKAFQFHYNPGSVDMSYGSVNDVDLGYLASGQAVTNFLQALGQISFEILLNRMPDMKYINPTGDFTKPGINYAKDVYDRTPRTGSNQTNELKDIYNKGTMYDLEFLLRVLMGGVSFTSLLRGGDITSDLGFAIPQPVELHLGNRLRYVISVTRLQVRHVIFNERMVPLFSTVSITANRVPADTVSATNLDLGGGAASTNTTDLFSPTANSTVNSHLKDLQGNQ